MKCVLSRLPRVIQLTRLGSDTITSIVYNGTGATTKTHTVLLATLMRPSESVMEL